MRQQREEPPGPTPRELAFVEEVAAFLGQSGMSPMSGRVLGWLLICDPPEQSAGDLVRVLRASKGSISMTLRLLVSMRLVERAGVPGARRTHYRIDAASWIYTWTTGLTAFSRLTERGLAILDGASPARRERLELFHGFYGRLQVELPALVERWQREWREGSSDDGSDPNRSSDQAIRRSSRAH